MLVFLDIRQNAGLFAKLIKTAEGFFERFIVTYLDACQYITPPLTV